MVHVAGTSSRILLKVEYSSIASITRPVSYSEDLPVPIFQGFKDSINEFSSESLIEQDTDNDDDVLLIAVAKILNQTHLIKVN